MKCRNWLNNHPGRKITRSQFGTLLSESWGKSTSQRNASSGFSSTGIYPFNSSIIPDYAFISDFYEEQNKGPIQPNVSNGSQIPEPVGRESKSPQPGTSKSVTDTIESPSRFLCELSTVSEIDNAARKSTKQVAEILTSKESIKEKTKNREKPKILNPKPRLYKKKAESTSEEECEIHLDSEDSAGEDDEYDCIRCGENYYKTKKTKIALSVFTVLNGCMNIVLRLEVLVTHVEKGQRKRLKTGKIKARRKEKEKGQM